MPTAARPGSDTGIEETCCPCDTPKGPPPPPYRYIIPRRRETPAIGLRSHSPITPGPDLKPRNRIPPQPLSPRFVKPQAYSPVPGHPPRFSGASIKEHTRIHPLPEPPAYIRFLPPNPAPGTRKSPRPAPPAHPAGPIPRRHRRVRIPVTGRAGPAPGPRGGGLNGRSDLIAARSGTCRRCLCFGRYHYIRCVRHREDPCGIFRTVFFARPGGGSARNPAPRGRHRPGRRLEGVLRLTAAPHPAYLDAHV